MEDVNPVATDPRVVAAELKLVLKREKARQRSARRRENDPTYAARIAKAWREKDVEHARELRRQSRIRLKDNVASLESARAGRRRYAKKNPELVKRLKRGWRKRHAPRVLELLRDWKQEKRTDKVMVAALALHGELMPVLPLPST